MRFAAVVVRPKQPAPVPAPEPIRERASAELGVLSQPAPPRPQQVPADLDQRVRLIGEW